MVKYKNFCEYMEDNFYDEIFDSLEKYIISRKDSFENEEIISVSWVELSAFHVSGVTFKDKGGNSLKIRITVDAEIEVKGRYRGGYDTFDESGCYNVFLSALLENGLHNVKITEVTAYNKNEFDRDKSLSQNLVPYMYEEDVERHAEEFLKKHCPKALLQPMAIPINEVLASLHMTMYYAPMEKNVFGKTYFGVEKVKVFKDIRQFETEEIMTAPGTMLINPDVHFMYNIGTANNTMIHECVHWDRHRRPFELQKLLQGECSHITCEIVEKYEGMKEDESAVKWMEWQASQLAPRILMPREMTIRKMREILQRRHNAEPQKRNAVLLEESIGELALYFGVSFIAAKLRIIELGCEQAEGVRVFHNGKYLPPYFFKSGSLKGNDTFLIDEENFVINLVINLTLRDLYVKGIIVYANCMVCINSPKYVQKDPDGKNMLTDYALDHVDECCFVFEREYSASEKYSDTFYRRCFLCKEIDSSSFIKAKYDPDHQINQKKKDMQAEIDKIIRQAEKMAAKMTNEVPSGFAGTLNYHMKRCSISADELSGRTGVSTVSISGYRNNTEPKIEPGTALALCKGLYLESDFAVDFMEKAGYKLDGTSPARIFVRILVCDHMDDTWRQWIEKIQMANIGTELLPKRNSEVKKVMSQSQPEA